MSFTVEEETEKRVNYYNTSFNIEYFPFRLLWKNHKVPVSQIQSCHLLDYEHQILSIVLSHCHYSLEHGKGQNVSYDLQALEKNIVDRFIHGKPLIQLEIPQVFYRKDVYTAKAFASIRNNVKPQVCVCVCGWFQYAKLKLCCI